VALELAVLNSQYERAYGDFLLSCPSAMLYHSLAYRRFLRDFLPSNAEDHYLLAFENGQLVGALPTFLIDGPLGAVLNSLPCFGSHGSLLLSQDANPETASFLANSLKDLCNTRSIAFATVIDTPLIANEEHFQRALGFQYHDQRIGQITTLPQEKEVEKINESLLALYHQKTRNIVRKALRSGLAFGYDQSPDTLDVLHTLHEINILGIGGIAKPKPFFETIARQFQADKDYRIYTARTRDNESVCALLLLYFKDTVEYFVPAIAEPWRSAQPLSALIHIAMRDAVLERSARTWNWGGTWLTQCGVYHFKSRWGTTDHPYKYYTRVFPDKQRLNGVSRYSMLQGYPWFYTVPFSVLEK
jgi:hypothetical protein